MSARSVSRPTRACESAESRCKTAPESLIADSRKPIPRTPRGPAGGAGPAHCAAAHAPRRAPRRTGHGTRQSRLSRGRERPNTAERRTRVTHAFSGAFSKNEFSFETAVGSSSGPRGAPSALASGLPPGPSGRLSLSLARGGSLEPPCSYTFTRRCELKMIAFKLLTSVRQRRPQSSARHA